MAPRALGVIVHEHASPAPVAVDLCPACLVGHTPAVAAVAGVVLKDPHLLCLAHVAEAYTAPALAFSHAAPLACGPPA